LTTKKRASINLFRKLKLQYLKLVRMKSAPSIVARGYAIGTFVEFITLPTLGIAFLLLYPFSKIFKASFAASLIGYVVTKTYVWLFLYWNFYVGNLILNAKFKMAIGGLKSNSISFFLGSSVNGLLISIVSYFLIYYFLIFYRWKKAKNKKLKYN